MLKIMKYISYILIALMLPNMSYSYDNTSSSKYQEVECESTVQALQLLPIFYEILKFLTIKVALDALTGMLQDMYGTAWVDVIKGKTGKSIAEEMNRRIAAGEWRD